MGRRLAMLGMRFVLFFLLTVSTAAAQVGHRPSDSPYRDIRKGHSFTVSGGYFQGDGGRLGVGPHEGEVIGGQYDIRIASSIQFGLSLSYGSLQRFIVDPTVSVNNRSGPVQQSVIFIDVPLHFNITGGKTWRRLAPYFLATGGLAIAEDTPEDQSGFDFGTKFFFAVGAGLRLFVTDRLHLRGEARPTLWKLSYPTTFQQPPQDNPSAPPVLGGASTEDWVTSWWLQAGLGYSFTF
jgi:hypothetical protein